MASYIFKACPKLNRWSSRQCPVNCSAISSSLLWQRGSRNLANCRGSRSPFTIARTRAIPVAPVRSATARCTRTFICSRLFCMHRTQSPCSATRFPFSRTRVRSLQICSGGRKAPGNSPQLYSRWIHSQSRRSVFVRPGQKVGLQSRHLLVEPIGSDHGSDVAPAHKRGDLLLEDLHRGRLEGF